MKTCLGILLCLLAFVGCTSKDTPVERQYPMLVVVEKALEVGSEPVEKELHLVATHPWSASVAGGKWCDLTPKQGEMGSFVIKVKIEENNSFDDRNMHLTFTMKDMIKTLEVTQHGKKAFLELKKEEYRVNASEQSINFSLNGNVDYELKGNADWISFVPLDITVFPKQYSISIKENTSYQPREVMLSVINEKYHIRKEFKLIQEKADAPTLSITSSDALRTSYIENTQEVSFTTNKLWKSAGGLNQVITVKQSAAPYIDLLSNDRMNIGSEGGQVRFTFERNVQCNVSSSQSWCKVRSSSTSIGRNEIVSGC